MTKILFSAEPRTITGRHVKRLRAQGLVPANLFGKNIPSLNLQVGTKDLLVKLREVGESTLLYLQIKGEKIDRPVFISQLVHHPVTGQLLHASFYQVDLKAKITTPVKIQLTGQAPAEKDKLGILVQQLDELEVEALPADMPDHIDLDVSGLASVDQAVYVKDLKLSTKLEVKSDPETIIVKIEPLAAEEKVEAPAPTIAEAGAETPSAVEGSKEGTTPSEKPAEEKSK